MNLLEWLSSIKELIIFLAETMFKLMSSLFMTNVGLLIIAMSFIYIIIEIIDHYFDLENDDYKFEYYDIKKRRNEEYMKDIINNEFIDDRYNEIQKERIYKHKMDTLNNKIVDDQYYNILNEEKLLDKEDLINNHNLNSMYNAKKRIEYRKYQNNYLKDIYVPKFGNKNTSPTPTWLNQTLEIQQATEEEMEEMDNLLSNFK